MPPSHDPSPFKGTGGPLRVFRAALYSRDGFLFALKNEAAFRQIALLQLILVLLAFFCPVSRIERVLMIAVCLISLIVELLNSAIEAAIDRISLEKHPLSKAAKDMGSAAQAVSLALIAVTWGIILTG